MLHKVHIRNLIVHVSNLNIFIYYNYFGRILRRRNESISRIHFGWREKKSENINFVKFHLIFCVCFYISINYFNNCRFIKEFGKASKRIRILRLLIKSWGSVSVMSECINFTLFWTRLDTDPVNFRSGKGLGRSFLCEDNCFLISLIFLWPGFT